MDTTRLGCFYRYKLLSILNIFSDIKKDDKILDIGGFDGYILANLKGDRSVIDIEVKEKFKNIKYIKYDFLKYRFPRQSFNYIFAFDVLEHIPVGTEKEFFEKAVSLLKTYGKFFVTTPSKNLKISPAFLTNYVNKKWGHFKCNGYTKKELKSYLKTIRGIKYSIFENSASYYLKSYLLLKFFWNLNKNFTKVIINKIAEKDCKNLKGNNGFYIVKVVKTKNS